MSLKKRALVDLSDLPILEGRVFRSISSHMLHRANSDPMLDPLQVSTLTEPSSIGDLQEQINALRESSSQHITQL